MNVPCSAWNLNQVSESFIKRISCRRWKINVKAASNLRPITEFCSINILFNQNSCLNETVKMAWVIFKVYIIYTLHSIFFKKMEQGKELEGRGPCFCPFGKGLLWVAVTKLKSVRSFKAKAQTRCCPFLLRQFPELNDSGPAKPSLISSLSTQQKLMSGWW